MPQYTQKKMCSECPFRACAIPGWLGPHTPEHFHQMIHTTESLFICHTHVDKMVDAGLTEEEQEESGQHCVGMLRYMNSVIRTSRDPERSKRQIELKKIPDQPLIAPFKFREYHENSILSKAKSM
jgi:hypothetical protein